MGGFLFSPSLTMYKYVNSVILLLLRYINKHLKSNRIIQSNLSKTAICLIHHSAIPKTNSFKEPHKFLTSISTNILWVKSLRLTT